MIMSFVSDFRLLLNNFSSRNIIPVLQKVQRFSSLSDCKSQNDDTEEERISLRLKKRIERKGFKLQDVELFRDGISSSQKVLESTRSSTSRSVDESSHHLVHSGEDLKGMVSDMALGCNLQHQPAEVFPSDYVQYQEWLRNFKVKDQSKKAFRPKVDPSITSLILFPGQGSQFVGMGSKTLQYGISKDLFEEASAVLKYDLLKLCLSGPLPALNKTINCQPAIFVCSLAALEKLRVLDPQAVESCVGTAGFSVGEYAALVLSGALSFADAIRLVQLRAESMQRASEEVSSGMVTVFLKHNTQLKQAMQAAREYCKQRCDITIPICHIANYLSPECKVIAGHVEALDFLEQHAKSFHICRTKRLPVSGAFHTKLMKPATQPFREAMSRVKFSLPMMPVFSNVTAGAYTKVDKMATMLTSQITEPVCWEQIMHVMYSRPNGDYFPTTFELGPGNQLKTLLRLVNLKAYHKLKSLEV